MGQLALGQQVALEDHVHRLQVELLGQVQHRQVLVVELAVLVGRVAVAPHQMAEVALVGFLVAVGVHRHEAVELHEPRIDPAHHPSVGGRHRIDHVRLEPGEGALLGQDVGGRGRQARIDGRAHQGDAGRPHRIAVFRHQRRRGQGRRSRLADGDDVGAAADLAQHQGDVVDVVVEVEAALDDRHVAGVDPVGDVDVVVLQEGLHRAAQQGGEVARQGRDDQHRGCVEGLAGGLQVGGFAPEAAQLHPGRAPDRLHVHAHIGLSDADLVDAPGRLGVAPGHVGGQVGGGVEGAAQTRGGRRIERRTPEVAGHLRRETQGGRRVVGGFVDGVEHVRRQLLCGAK